MLKTLKFDLPASLVVFFVALPLCLGIALASGAPLFSGIVAGVIGGLVVGSMSGSALGVSGPAAGLAVIVFAAIQALNDWPSFLMAVVVCGVLQLALGWVKAGFIAYFFPSSVIRGMLTGIGLLIILKQLPIALGFHDGALTNLSFFQLEGKVAYHTINTAWHQLAPLATLISLVSLLTLVLWEQLLIPRLAWLQWLPGPLVVVLLGVMLNHIAGVAGPGLSLNADRLVQLPIIHSWQDLWQALTPPRWSSLATVAVWQYGLLLAVVASLETLLCVEATDKLDPLKRVTPVNRELQAQGWGNVLSGLAGGLPITQVIVRSSANITFGAKTKLSTVLHGGWLLLSVMMLTQGLNQIPLASLAAILILIGYKLAAPGLFKRQYQLGVEQFIPFLVTIAGIVTFDLLKGIGLGMACSLCFTLFYSYRDAYVMKDVVTTEQGHEVHHMVLAETVCFFSKARISQVLESLPPRATVIIDCRQVKRLAYDVAELIDNFHYHASLKDITVKTLGCEMRSWAKCAD